MAHTYMSTTSLPLSRSRGPAARTQALRAPGTWFAIAAALLLGASFFLSFWTMRLYAPQYPGGLGVTIYLDRVAGDVEEIDVLNHYIGMSGLGQAAAVERAAAPFLVAGLVALALVTPLVAYRVKILAALSVAGFPFGVLADLYYWLYRFGHTLDAAAPIRLDPFTPALLGWGKVGQFKTYATLGGGFLLALGAAVLVAVTVWLQRRPGRTPGVGAR